MPKMSTLNGYEIVDAEARASIKKLQDSNGTAVASGITYEDWYWQEVNYWKRFNLLYEDICVFSANITSDKQLKKIMVGYFSDNYISTSEFPSSVYGNKPGTTPLPTRFIIPPSVETIDTSKMRFAISEIVIPPSVKSISSNSFCCDYDNHAVVPSLIINLSAFESEEFPELGSNAFSMGYTNVSVVVRDGRADELKSLANWSRFKNVIEVDVFNPYFTSAEFGSSSGGGGETGYYYTCNDCGAQWTLQEIEDYGMEECPECCGSLRTPDHIYYCPSCGTWFTQQELDDNDAGDTCLDCGTWLRTSDDVCVCSNCGKFHTQKEYEDYGGECSDCGNVLVLIDGSGDDSGGDSGGDSGDDSEKEYRCADCGLEWSQQEIEEESAGCPDCGGMIYKLSDMSEKLLECPECGHQCSLNDVPNDSSAFCPECYEGILVITATGSTSLECPECGEEIDLVNWIHGDNGRCPNCGGVHVTTAIKALQ